MKKLFSILAVALLLSCSNDDSTQPKCDCGTVTEIENLQGGRWEVTVKRDCDKGFYTFTTRVNDLGYDVGYRLCE